MAILLNFGAYDAMIRGLLNILHPTTTNNYIKIYKGTIPSDANDWTEGGSSADLLATFNKFGFIQAISDGDVQSLKFNNKPDPNPVNASATGTAAWYALYNIGPANSYSPIIGDVTAFGGTATLQLDSLSITSGNPVTIKHFAIRLQN